MYFKKCTAKYVFSSARVHMPAIFAILKYVCNVNVQSFVVWKVKLERIECMRSKALVWTPEAEKAFHEDEGSKVIS